MDRNEYLVKIGRTINFILDNVHYEHTSSFGTAFCYDLKNEPVVSIRYIASDFEPHLSVVSYNDTHDGINDVYKTTNYYQGRRKNIEFIHEDEELLQIAYDLTIKYKNAEDLFEF